MKWQFYQSQLGAQVVRQEIEGAWEGQAPSEKIARQAEILQRLNAAARGELALGEQLKPVARDPYLWEIRWVLGGQHWRLYHAEPTHAPGWLVGLRFHLKIICTSPADTATRQNAEIDLARQRYNEGRIRLWGIP